MLIPILEVPQLWLSTRGRYGCHWKHPEVTTTSFPVISLLRTNALEIPVLPASPMLTWQVCTMTLPIESESESHSVVSNSLQPYGLYSPWNSPGQISGLGSLSILQGIFPTQGSNPGLLHCRQILYQLSHKGSPSPIEPLPNLSDLVKYFQNSGPGEKVINKINVNDNDNIKINFCGLLSYTVLKGKHYNSHFINAKHEDWKRKELA